MQAFNNFKWVDWRCESSWCWNAPVTKARRCYLIYGSQVRPALAWCSPDDRRMMGAPAVQPNRSYFFTQPFSLGNLVPAVTLWVNCDCVLGPEINCTRSRRGRKRGRGGGVNAIYCNVLQCIRVILRSASMKESLQTLQMGETGKVEGEQSRNLFWAVTKHLVRSASPNTSQRVGFMGGLWNLLLACLLETRCSALTVPWAGAWFTESQNGAGGTLALALKGPKASLDLFPIK